MQIGNKTQKHERIVRYCNLLNWFHKKITFTIYSEQVGI